MTELERIGEEMEVAAWSDLLAWAPVARLLGASVLRRGGATVLRCPGVDSFLLNRTFGVTRPRDVEPVLRLYEEDGIRRFFVHVYEGQEDVARELTRVGVPRHRRSWVKLARAGRDPPPPGRGELLAGRTPPSLAPAVASVLGSALGLPPPATPLLAAAAVLPGWRMFHVSAGGAPVAGGLLFTRGEAAYLAGGGTAPAFRGRGAQGRLLEARIRAALELGCRVVVGETGEAVEGEPQHSERNMTRNGLRPVGRRHNHAPAAPVPT